MNSTQYLFCYGTLLRDHAPQSVSALCRRLPRLTGASVRGSLYDLGTFPGMVLPEEGSGYRDDCVRGEIVVVQSSSDWLRLDTYEGYDDAHPDRSLFKRVRVTATTESGDRVECWTYVYNRTLKNASKIDSGCWRTYLADGEEFVAVPC